MSNDPPPPGPGRGPRRTGQPATAHPRRPRSRSGTRSRVRPGGLRPAELRRTTRATASRDTANRATASSPRRTRRPGRPAATAGTGRRPRRWRSCRWCSASSGFLCCGRSSCSASAPWSPASSARSRSTSRQGRLKGGGMAIAGLILGAVGIVIGVVYWILIAGRRVRRQLLRSTPLTAEPPARRSGSGCSQLPARRVAQHARTPTITTAASAIHTARGARRDRSGGGAPDQARCVQRTHQNTSTRHHQRRRAGCCSRAPSTSPLVRSLTARRRAAAGAVEPGEQRPGAAAPSCRRRAGPGSAARSARAQRRGAPVEQRAAQPVEPRAARRPRAASGARSPQWRSVVALIAVAHLVHHAEDDQRERRQDHADPEHRHVPSSGRCRPRRTRRGRRRRPSRLQGCCRGCRTWGSSGSVSGRLTSATF